MKKKALFFIQSGMGGAERMTLFIASCLDRSNYDVIFYVIGKDWGVMKQLIPTSNKQHLIQVESYRDFLTFKMAMVLHREKPDVTFSSVFPFNYRLCVASILFPKIRVIVRSDNYLYTQTFFQKIRLFIGYRFLDYLIAQTDEMKDEHIRLMWLNKSKIGTFSNPVDTETIDSKTEDALSPFDPSKTNYVFAGRIAYIKGIDTLLNSFALVLKTNPLARLFILGDYTGIFLNYYQELTRLSISLKIQDSVFFTGFTNNPYKYMKHADCFVLPSRNEGLPNVVIESLYLGTPVAVTRCVPVVTRIVDEGVTGFTTEVDNVEGLAFAMLNAPRLGRVVSSYTSATKEDFKELFA